MSQSTQKLVYQNRVTLASGEQITLLPAVLGLQLQNQKAARVTQVDVAQGLEYELNETLGVTDSVVIYNPTPNEIENAHINITAQHSIEYKPVTEVAVPAAVPIADSSKITGKEERTFAVLSPELNAVASRLPFDTAGESTLPAGTISWDLVNTGRFTLERAGKYQISVLASLSADAVALVACSLVRDPANAGSGPVIEQQTGTVFPDVTIPDDISVFSGNLLLQEIVEITALQAAGAAPDRTFQCSVTPAPDTVVLTRGFTSQAAAAKCANIIIEKIS